MIDVLEFIHIEEISNGFMFTTGQAKSVKTKNATTVYCKDQKDVIVNIERILLGIKSQLEALGLKDSEDSGKANKY
jgi:hypothetical protein